MRLSQHRFFTFIPLAAAVLVLGGFAFMHLHLKASLPAADATVKHAPSQIVLIFSAHPEAALSRVQLMGPDSATVATGQPAAGADSLSLAIPVTGKLAEGRYTVRWRAAGRDGHPATGDFAFTVGGSGGGNAAASAAVSRDHSAD
ncbi:MAG TPA: copper resistance protein CopC [Gemmatimonadales bacterium]|nr:copper resistance protein CopC [Gemmatimonadales bacterium]